MAQQYEVLSVQKMFEILDSSEVVSEEQLDYNGAIVERLRDGRILVSPNIGAEGVLFYSEQAYQKMLAEQYFPVKDDGSIYEKNRREIKDIQNNIPFFLEDLSSKLKMEVKPINDERYLDELSRKVRKYAARHTIESIELPLWILAGELLRTQIDGGMGVGESICHEPVLDAIHYRRQKTLVPFGRVFFRAAKEAKAFFIESHDGQGA